MQWKCERETGKGDWTGLEEMDESYVHGEVEWPGGRGEAGWRNRTNFRARVAKQHRRRCEALYRLLGLVLEGREVGGTHGTGEPLECLQTLRRHWWPFSVNLYGWFAFEQIPYGNNESCEETIDGSNTRASSLIHNSEIWNSMKNINFLLTWLFMHLFIVLCISLYVSLLLLFSHLVISLCNPKAFIPPGSSVHGVLKRRILQWVAISFCRGSSRSRDRTYISCIGRKILYHWATRKATSMFHYKCVKMSQWGFDYASDSPIGFDLVPSILHWALVLKSEEIKSQN